MPHKNLCKLQFDSSAAPNLIHLAWLVVLRTRRTEYEPDTYLIRTTHIHEQGLAFAGIISICMYLKVSEHKIQGETEWSSESLKLHENMITAVVVAWQ